MVGRPSGSQGGGGFSPHKGKSLPETMWKNLSGVGVKDKRKVIEFRAQS